MSGAPGKGKGIYLSMKSVFLILSAPKDFPILK